MGSRNFNEFANTLSFYSSKSQHIATLSTASPPVSSSSPPHSLLNGNLTVSLENRPIGYGTAPPSANACSSPPAGFGKQTVGSGSRGRGGGITGEDRGGIIAGYAYKSLALAKNGVESLSVGAREFVDNASGRLQDASVRLSSTRLMYFGIAAGVGCLFMAFAFLLFPMILIAPAKFALMFTMGSISFMVSFGLLKGFQALLAHLISWERLPFTFTYVATLLLTLYSTLVYPSRILALLFSIIQLCALLSFLVSYIPGGTNMLKVMGYTILSFIKSSFRRSDGGSSDGPGLPV